MGSGLPTAYELSNGMVIPSIGLGSVGLEKVDSLVSAIMDTGYVLIDTATAYRNDKFIGEAL